MKKARRGFTLIEMILMIVILGIAFTTLPIILGVSGRSAGGIADVRGLFHGVAKLQVALSKPWDQANVDDFDTAGIYYVIGTLESNSPNPPGNLLACNINNKTRRGHYPGRDRRMCEPGITATPQNAFADGGFDDLDDFDGVMEANVEGYDVNTSVDYVPYIDASPAAMTTGPGAVTTTNVKRITVTVTAPNGVLLSTYRYYAANIGLSKPFIKRN